MNILYTIASESVKMTIFGYCTTIVACCTAYFNEVRRQNREVTRYEDISDDFSVMYVEQLIPPSIWMCRYKIFQTMYLTIAIVCKLERVFKRNFSYILLV